MFFFDSLFDLFPASIEYLRISDVMCVINYTLRWFLKLFLHFVMPIGNRFEAVKDPVEIMNLVRILPFVIKKQFPGIFARLINIRSRERERESEISALCSKHMRIPCLFIHHYLPAG